MRNHVELDEISSCRTGFHSQELREERECVPNGGVRYESLLADFREFAVSIVEHFIVERVTKRSQSQDRIAPVSALVAILAYRAR